MNPLIVFAGIMTGVTLLAPFRWVWRIWLLLSVLLVTVIAFAPAERDPGIAYLLGVAILILSLIYFVLLFLVRVAYQSIFAERKTKTVSPGSMETVILRVSDLLLCAISSCAMALLLALLLARILASAPFGALFHLAIIAVTVGAMIVVLTLTPGAEVSKRKRTLAIFIPGLSVLLITTVFSTLYPLRVLSEAQSFALGAPYCIALGERERAASSWQDIMFFTMDKDLRSVAGHHAILLVERDGNIEPYHWSYRAGTFRPGVVNWFNHNRSPVACRPKSGFGTALNLYSPTATSVREVYFHGQHLQIPQAFEPYWSGNYLSIATTAPDFSPTKKEFGRLYPSMQVRSRQWLQQLADRHIADQLPGETGGLITAANVNQGVEIYFRVSDTGEILTLINCHASRRSETRCRHRFYRNGRMYSFDHSYDLLDQYEQMEERLVQLFSSFERE